MEINILQELYSDLPETTVGKKIRKQRFLKSIFKKDLAEYIGVSPKTIESYEFNKAYPSPQKLVKIAEYFKVPIEYFYDEYYEFVFGNYSERIRNWRKENKLSLKVASGFTGIGKNSLNKWERGIGYPDRIMYEKLIDVIERKEF